MREAATCCAESFPGDYVQAIGDREGCEIIIESFLGFRFVYRGGQIIYVISNCTD